ncbi:MAG: flagellar hook assembly protein FlgD [Steroidobacteraceae bacterium]
MASTTIPSSVRQSLPAGITSFEAEQQKEIERSTTLGQEDFLKLMTAQLKNQDPMQPMENGEFLGQMAQFSTVSSIGEMAKELKALSEQMVSSRLLSSGSLIGRSVL